MNEEICMGIGIIFVAVVYIVLTVLHNRRTADNAGERVKQAEESNQSAQQSIERVTDTVADCTGRVDSIKDTVGELGTSIETSGNIFEEIRKQKLDK